VSPSTVGVTKGGATTAGAPAGSVIDSSLSRTNRIAGLPLFIDNPIDAQWCAKSQPCDFAPKFVGGLEC
jgi:hypothetical protein